MGEVTGIIGKWGYVVGTKDSLHERQWGYVVGTRKVNLSASWAYVERVEEGPILHLADK
jgi:hypothetical protein